MLEDAYLKSGQEKTTLGVETDRLLAEPDHIKSFQKVFALSLKKLNDHIDKHTLPGPITRLYVCLIPVSSLQ